MVKQHISALMDGELFDDEAATLLDRLKRNPEGYDEWSLYHLISDTLRQPDQVHADLSAALRERLQDEPTVLAPRSRGDHRARWFAVSAAASVMALAVVAWLSAQVAPEAAPQLAMVQQGAGDKVRPAKLSAKRRMDEYLTAHQEFAAANVQSTYLRTVSERQ
jgi:sigma-E factor negative regulatory protein RseA